MRHTGVFKQQCLIEYFYMFDFLSQCVNQLGKLARSSKACDTHQIQEILSLMWVVLSHFSHVRLFAILWTVACQAPLSVGLSRQEYWSGLPFPSPEDLPNPEIEPMSLKSPALPGRFFTTSTTWEGKYFTSSTYTWVTGNHLLFSIHRCLLFLNLMAQGKNS